ncbi:TIGR03842 family LLM class F420-dependent oxidoreductase [Aquamicrobium defluvii]|uniref:Methylene-tetrahydromethanopterin reductase n=1 Tax=Aquamicrobium defluvii TaxID=69279 RepID=A0A011U744_9HYPH|nr:TIGR03842 family LLM class F420-dependent oxidoreductase [Aquamicrobium defluvii]EXL01891.1 methylene-tetrahydromethanopterin reductase [Aquamicrobium defluvii]EZQ12896.1 methylene-tetrahydromethanopterin reductase [Halopseudomonas bauzanensis]TDR31890.1 methylenetetrahydromethanopterin reductase [Aquamicrobium defluvii]
MEFGITFKGFVEPDRARYLVRAAEYAGFSHCWFYDSHILWRECYPAIAMCMEHTRDMHFGPLVTNPDVRDWSVAGSLFASLNKQSNGRFEIAVGRGDSSRRVMGKKPAPLSRVTEFVQKMKAMVRGEEVTYPECPEPVKLPWAVGHEMPAWIGAYGPLALKAAGEAADGVVLQIAEPSLCKWFTDQCIEAGNAAGRDMSRFRSMAAAPAYFGPMDKAIEATKWFPAMVGNHVADIVEKYGSDSGIVPKSLTSYIEKRRGYDYSKHGQSDNPYLDFITPDIVESFCVLGEPEQHIAKIKELEAAGVTQFNIYLDSGEEEEIIARYGREVIPAFAKN